ncbi:nuclear transport factor 2 family protein [Rheinheimera riviphila]|uniref:Nuclear transport factor 2 family protein n=1 Tax=Rheinheimera riviphila TaxID=1834037 RepID=A0A437R4Q1_9GAMM|nr:nuclear transport factor 2 family protein [Rheinheimera riviphila]RVU41750.1 nuclear transport factor 2 family protein [Rheinheimera riviphila]
MNTNFKNISKTVSKTCIAMSLSLGLSGYAMASTQLQLHAEYAAIDTTMQTMMQAFEQGSAPTAFKVILKDTVVVGYSGKQQKVVSVSGEEWAKGFQPAPDEDQRHRKYQILDITDTGAVVKVMLDYPQWLGVDYLAMTKINGQWRVVSKSWSGTPKSAK